MKAHRKNRHRNAYLRYKMHSQSHQVRLVDNARAVARRELTAFYAFWQTQHIGENDIVYTLSTRMSAESHKFSSDPLERLAWIYLTHIAEEELKHFKEEVLV